MEQIDKVKLPNVVGAVALLQTGCTCLQCAYCAVQMKATTVAIAYETGGTKEVAFVLPLGWESQDGVGLQPHHSSSMKLEPIV